VQFFAAAADIEPSGQGKHIDEDRGEYLPGPQMSHCTLPDTFEKYPGAHAEQKVAETNPEKNPTGHKKHSVAPNDEVNCPLPHLSQTDIPCKAWLWPG